MELYCGRWISIQGLPNGSKEQTYTYSVFGKTSDTPWAGPGRPEAGARFSGEDRGVAGFTGRYFLCCHLLPIRWMYCRFLETKPVSDISRGGKKIVLG